MIDFLTIVIGGAILGLMVMLVVVVALEWGWRDR